MGCGTNAGPAPFVPAGAPAGLAWSVWACCKRRSKSLLSIAGILCAADPSRLPGEGRDPWRKWAPAFEGVTQSRILHDVFLGGMFNLRVFTSPGYLARPIGRRCRECHRKGVVHGYGCGHAIAGIAIAAAAAIRRRRVLAQHRLSASACNRQTARTFSRLCTRKRDMPRFLMMPCARSVSLRRR